MALVLSLKGTDYSLKGTSSVHSETIQEPFGPNGRLGMAKRISALKLERKSLSKNLVSETETNVSLTKQLNMVKSGLLTEKATGITKLTNKLDQLAGKTDFLTNQFTNVSIHLDVLRLNWKTNWPTKLRHSTSNCVNSLSIGKMGPCSWTEYSSTSDPIMLNGGSVEKLKLR